jgi:hypothetical protein
MTKEKKEKEGGKDNNRICLCTYFTERVVGVNAWSISVGSK